MIYLMYVPSSFLHKERYCSGMSLYKSYLVPIIIQLTITGLEGHICPSLVKDWKDICVPLLSRHCAVIVRPFRA